MRVPHSGTNSRFLIIGAGMLLVLMSVASPGCMQSPGQKLIGRWYNSGMSVRFRENGTVLYNSPSGRAEGVYYFNERGRNLSSNQPSPNLTLDVVRNGERIRMDFELEIISRDRVRLTEVNPNRRQTTRRPENAPPPFTILKRADESLAAR